MSRLAVLALCGVLVSLLSACNASLRLGGPPIKGPKCPTRVGPSPAGVSGALLLTAQAVPSASAVPCLRDLPAGWTFRDLKARKGKARFILDFGREDGQAATVTLTHKCDVRGASEAVSDLSGARRYERVDGSTSQYRSERFYVTSGACITYDFALHGSAGAEQVSMLSKRLGFVDRTVLRRYVHDYSDGRFELDPTPEAS